MAGPEKDNSQETPKKKTVILVGGRQS